MTLDAFLDRVPWADMAVTNIGQVRSESLHDPICAVFGGENFTAHAVAVAQGLSPADAHLLLSAADNVSTPEAQALRAEMLRRMAGAR